MKNDKSWLDKDIIEDNKGNTFYTIVDGQKTKIGEFQSITYVSEMSDAYLGARHSTITSGTLMNREVTSFSMSGSYLGRDTFSTQRQGSFNPSVSEETLDSMQAESIRRVNLRPAYWGLCI